MNKEELRNITKEYTASKGFEIVAFVGEARSMLIKALNEAETSSGAIRLRRPPKLSRANRQVLSRSYFCDKMGC